MQRRNKTAGLDISRREFLGGASALLALAAQKNLLLGSTALASGGQNPTTLVSLVFSGGPCMLSSYLSPTAHLETQNVNSAWLRHGMGNTFYSGGGYTTPISGSPLSLQRTPVLGRKLSQWMTNYWTFPHYTTYWMPRLWDSPMPRLDSQGNAIGNMVMKVNLEQCALIYGVKTLDSHPIARNMILAPESGMPTISGLLADQSPNLPFAALRGLNGIDEFKSAKGLGMRSLYTYDNASASSNCMKSLLSPLITQNTSNDPLYTTEGMTTDRRNWLQGMTQTFTNALSVIKNQQEPARPGVSTLYDIMSSARTQLQSTQYIQIVEEYYSAFTRYQTLMNLAMDKAANEGALKGINDQGAISISPTHDILTTNSGPKVTNSDLKTILVRDGTSNQTRIESYLASNFAFAEIAIKYGLTSSIQIGTPGEVNNFHMQLDGSASTTLTTVTNDAHPYGAAIKLFETSVLVYVVNTLLHHFRTRLTELNKSKDTLIILSSEFTRSQRTSGNGSDHGTTAGVVGIMSGYLPESVLTIRGSLCINTDPNYYGAWGTANPNGGAIDIKNVSSTLISLLGLPSSALNPANTSFGSISFGTLDLMNISSPDLSLTT